MISRDGEVLEMLAPLLDYFDVENRSMSAISWTRTRSAGILRRLVKEDKVTHEALDVEGSAPAANFLRALLVFTGVLLPRASELDDTIPWLAQRLSAVQPQHQTVVRRYAVWHVLWRAKRRPRRPATRHHARECLLLALRLVSWLESEGHELEGLSQADLDRWLLRGRHC